MGGGGGVQKEVLPDGLLSNFWTVRAHREVYGRNLSVAESGLTEKIWM